MAFDDLIAVDSEGLLLSTNDFAEAVHLKDGAGRIKPVNALVYRHELHAQKGDNGRTHAYPIEIEVSKASIADLTGDPDKWQVKLVRNPNKSTTAEWIHITETVPSEVVAASTILGVGRATTGRKSR